MSRSDDVVFNDEEHEALAKRMARMESRIVQMMLHLGIDPHEKKYESPHKSTKHTGPSPRSGNAPQQPLGRRRII